MREKIWSKMCSLAYRLHRLNRLSSSACVHYESWRNLAGYSYQPEVRNHSVLKTISGWLTGMVSSVKEMKMVSSPPTLKRTRTSKVLGKRDSRLTGGMDYCWSLSSWDCGVFSLYHECPTNLSKYNKVVQFCGEQQLCILSQAWCKPENRKTSIGKI